MNIKIGDHVRVVKVAENSFDDYAIGCTAVVRDVCADGVRVIWNAAYHGDCGRDARRLKFLFFREIEVIPA